MEKKVRYIIMKTIPKTPGVKDQELLGKVSSTVLTFLFFLVKLIERELVLQRNE